MKALICEEPGRFEYGTRPEPAKTDTHAILKIKRIGICGTDLHAFEGTQPFFQYPRILGHELAAEIASINSTDFKIGEQVTFIPYFNCGHCIACRNGLENCCVAMQVCGVHVDGGMAEYLSVPVKALLHGEGMSYDELALVEPLAIGAHGIRRAEVKPGEFVLVVGAGPIGLGVMEFARIAGAQVIAMDMNEKRLAFCSEKLKVPHIINASRENVSDRLKEITNGDFPTVIIDATGNLKAINNAFQWLAHGGRYVLIGLQKADITFNHPEFHKREATLMSSRNATKEDFEHVIAQMKNKNVTPSNYITHRVGFDEVKSAFGSWLDPVNGVIKAMVNVD